MFWGLPRAFPNQRGPRSLAREKKAFLGRRIEEGLGVHHVVVVEEEEKEEEEEEEEEKEKEEEEDLC